MTAFSLGLVAGLVGALLVLAASPIVQRMAITSLVALRYLFVLVAGRLRGETGQIAPLVRRAFEDLGPTYIKLGQIVASSVGLFPKAFVAEFGKTLDRVRPFDLDEARHIVREELGVPLDEIFASFDEAPLASASIAQVHAARLLDGRDVVVKIQRPRIEARVDADVAILYLWARLLALVPTAELANPVGIIEDFDQTIHEELDFAREAANMVEFNRIMVELGHDDIRAPEVVPSLTTRRVLVMERFRGVRVDDVAAIRERGIDAEGRLVHGLRAWFQCMILYGFFHGDVHAGNLMLLDDGRLGFLDFGIIGRFDDEQRHMVTQYIVAFATGNYRHLGQVMLEMGSVDARVDLDTLAADLAVAYAPMLQMSLGDLKYGELLPNIMKTAVKHRMRLPNEFVLVTKQMLFFDRYAKLLAPNLNIFTDPRLIANLGQDVLRAQMATAARR